MKLYTFIAALFITMLSVTAQDSDKAKALLNEVSEKVQSYDNIVLDFKYSLENNAENIRQDTRGDASLKGEKYLLNLMGTTQMFDGKNIYSIIPEDEEINISEYVEEDDNAITPSKMMTFYKEGYTYKWDITQNKNGRQIQYIKLTPIDTKADIKSILLGIDKQTKNIYNLIQTQNNGTKITITVNSFKANQPLSETLFTFDESKYADYYINRLD